MDHTTTAGLASNELAWLLALGTETGVEEAEPEQTVGELFHAWLHRTVPAASESAADGKPLGEALLSGSAEVASLEAIKNYFKALESRRGPETQRGAALVFYYAAIAAALVFHDEKITRLPDEALRSGLAELSALPWLPAEFKDLFGKARHRSTP